MTSGFGLPFFARRLTRHSVAGRTCKFLLVVFSLLCFCVLPDNLTRMSPGFLQPGSATFSDDSGAVAYESARADPQASLLSTAVWARTSQQRWCWVDGVKTAVSIGWLPACCVASGLGPCDVLQAGKSAALAPAAAVGQRVHGTALAALSVRLRCLDCCSRLRRRQLL